VRSWRRSRAVHGPAKILLDLAIAVAVGGDRPADIGHPHDRLSRMSCGKAVVWTGCATYKRPQRITELTAANATPTIIHVMIPGNVVSARTTRTTTTTNVAAVTMPLM